MRLWKTCGIELKTNNPLLQTNLDKFIKPYRDLKELINNWNTAACKTTNGSTKGNIWKIFNDSNAAHHPRIISPERDVKGFCSAIIKHNGWVAPWLPA